MADAAQKSICCANDLEQAQGRVFQAVREIIEASPQLLAIAKITVDKITLADATVRAIPANFASAAGSEQNLGVFDELWAVSSERARRLFDELVPVPTRRIACRLTVTHAGFENESALLLELYKRGLRLPLVGKDLYAGDGMLMFWTHDPIAPWQDEKWIAQMRRDLRPVQFLRMAENRFTSSENNFIDVASWDRCVDPALSHVANNPMLRVFVGLDASVKNDDTAIVVVTFDSKSQIVRLFTHRIFTPTPGAPVDFSLIEQALVDLSRRYMVVKVLYDPFQMASSAQRLVKLGLRLEEYPQTPSNLTAASQNLYDLIKSQSLIAYPDAAMRAAISNAIATETPRGWKISKQTQSSKIDVVLALAMLRSAAVRSQGESLFLGFGENEQWTGYGLPAGMSEEEQRREEEASNRAWRVQAMMRANGF